MANHLKTRLTFLDDFNMPSDAVWGPNTPGQLSGLVYDDPSKSYFVISDDRYKPNDVKSRGSSRFYPLQLPITKTGDGDKTKWKIEFPQQTHFVLLKDPHNQQLIFEEGDCEGIAKLPNGNLAISTEGHAKLGEKVGDRPLSLRGPVVYEFSRKGKLIQTFATPDYYNPVFAEAQQRSGIIFNNGFESLTTDPSGNIFTMTEGPLFQEGGMATFDHGGLARLLKFSRKEGKYQPTKEFAYPVDAIPLPKTWPQKGVAERGENGVVEMIALDEEHLLVLERAWVEKPYFRNHIRLYKIDLQGATDTLGVPKLDASVKTVKKELVLDFETIIPQLEPTISETGETKSGQLENYEGMALTTLPDGNKGLIIIADNNHNVRQRQSLLLFRIDGI